MDSTDFRAAEGFYESQSSDLFLSLPPLLLLALALLGVALFLGGLELGRRRRRTTVDAAPAIWKRIDAACRAAMTANSDILPDRARALRRTIDDRLGPVLTLAGGLAEPLRALDVAMAARTDDPPAGAPPPSDGDARPAPGKPSPPAAPGQDGRSAVTVMGDAHVVIHGAAANAEAHGPDRAPGDRSDPHAPAGKDGDKPAGRAARDMTVEERADALRRAVSRINDHWCHRDARIEELRAARRILTDAPPREPAPSAPKSPLAGH